MAIAIIVIGALLLYACLSFFGAIFAMRIQRFPMTTSPAAVGLAYRDVSFPSRDDNVLLKGWYLPAKGDAVIVMVFGGNENRVDANVDTLPLARDLVAKGYNVLLFDLRGRGESAGKGLALSNIDGDIGGAVDYLEASGHTMAHICLVGFCSGAAAACTFASRNHIGALVLDGCFATVPNIVISEAAAAGIPKFLVKAFIPGLRIATKAIYHRDLIDPVAVVADITCPILFIHEKNDNFISQEEMYRLYNKAVSPAKEFWSVSADHSRSYRADPAAFIAKVNEFFVTRAAPESASD